MTPLKIKLNMLAPIASWTSIPAKLRHGTSRTPPMPMQPINNPDRKESVTITIIGGCFSNQRSAAPL